MRHIITVGVALVGAIIGAAPASAWDDHGHRIIAFMAERYIRSNALEQVNALLGADIDHLTDHDLAGAATWADHYLASDQAASRQRYEASVQWHFANIEANRPNLPRTCNGHPPLPPGTLASSGPADACIIDKIQQFADELGDRTLSRQERLLALKFLLNLVGDVHEPLRVSDEHDDHGRIVPVSSNDLQPSTLFDYWESSFARAFGADPAIAGQRLAQKISSADARAWASGTPQLWALEAHQVGVDKAYGMLGSMDRTGRFVLSPQDVDDAVDSVALQLSRAAVRLAYVINEALAPLPPAATVNAPKGSVAAGRTFAQANCSLCHVIEGAEGGPFTMAPDFVSIANTRGVSEDALREFLFGPHPSMPSIALQGHNANDVIAFILSQKRKTAPRPPR